MSSAFDVLRPSRARIIGLCVAVGLLALLANLPAGIHASLPLGIAIDTGAHAGTVPTLADRAFTSAALILGTTLPWLFAERAIQPGWRAALATALGLDLAAVVLGSFVAAAFVTFDVGGDAGMMVGGTLVFGLLGLVFVGVPMLVLVFVVAIAWVSILRVLAGLLELRVAASA